MSVFERAREIFCRALDLKSSDRGSFLDDACHGDPRLRNEVESLLTLDRDATNFLDPPSVPLHRPTDGRSRGHDFAVGDLISGRYRLAGVLGRGSSGFVQRADDRLSGRPVAVKLLTGLSEEALRDVRREVGILRLLRLPGVVSLLDEGVHEGIPFIVMRLVEGRPFGSREGGEREETVRALFETLESIHRAGVLHRDLKPDNVLVDATGRPIVLDLGTAAEALAGELAQSSGPEGTIVGTPNYLAPERLRGGAATIETDLYAVGVMLYQAVSGQVPHQADSFADLVLRRTSEPAPPLATVAPDASPRMAGLVDRLLALEPGRRPASAGEVLAVLGREPAGGGPPVPWLGGDEPILRVVQGARSGRFVCVRGAPGSGRTRTLEEAIRILGDEGRETVRLPPGSTPFESLAPVVGDPDTISAESLEQAGEVARARLRDAAERGVVLVADDYDALDSWTRAAADSGSLPLAVLAAGRGEGAPDAAGLEVVRLAPLSEEDLRPLFAGPDRVFHLREDAARELHALTAGNPGRIAEELEAWFRAGLARPGPAGVLVKRTGLDRLASALRPFAGPSAEAGRLPPGLEDTLLWIALAATSLHLETLAAAAGRPVWRLRAEVEDLVRLNMVRVEESGRVAATKDSPRRTTLARERRDAMHVALADAFPPGVAGRLLHLVTAGRRREIPAEAIAAADGKLALGRLGEARSLLVEGLLAARETEDLDAERGILSRLVRGAMMEGTVESLDHALYHLSGSRATRAAVFSLEALARGALLALNGDGERALETLDKAEFADPEEERWRRSACVVASRYLNLEREVEVVRDCSDWALASEEPAVRAAMLEWQGWLEYRRGRFPEAARLHEECAELAEGPLLRVSALLNAASACLETVDLDEAARAAERARQVAAEMRHPLHEARAEWVIRSARYRSGAAKEPDRELVQAMEALEAPNLRALVLLNEAAVAWRAGRDGLARDYALRCVSEWSRIGQRWGSLLARALAASCGEPLSAAELEDAIASARECPVKGVAAQVFGLLARVAPERAAECRREALAAGSAVPESGRRIRREVTSIEEAIGPEEPDGSDKRETENGGTR